MSTNPSNPAAKRRRIDAAHTTLTKPFRSPFKTPFKSPVKASSSSSLDTVSTPDPNPQSALTPKDTNTLLATASPLSLPSKPILTPKRVGPGFGTPHLPRPTTTKKSFSSPLSTSTALTTDPDIAPLLRAQRELERQLREVKESLDAASQAHKIEVESQKHGSGEIDGELVMLIGKWRGAGRLAAEELFGKVRERVNRMGGPRAWKDAQRKREEWNGGWDQEDERKGDEDGEDGEGEGEKRDLYAEYGVEVETENERSQREKGAGDTGELPGEEDEFTMAMMLRTLNVDLDVIGYDREGQRWID